MASQTTLTTRRQFLSRSAWGFGSAFILPSLLASCTDHLIDPTNPGIGTPVIPPLGDQPTADDWNNGLKTTITTALQLVPDVGGFLGALVDIYWPTLGPSPWDQLKSQVQALIGQDIDTYVVSNIGSDLETLNDLLNYYHAALKAVNWDTVTWPRQPSGTDPTSQAYITNQALDYVYQTWTAADNKFTDLKHHIELDGYQTVLLPLFAQYANLYLAFYRDPLLVVKNSYDQPIRDPKYNTVQHGKLWGMTPLNISRVREALTLGTTTFSDYVTKYYTDHLNTLNQQPADYVNNEPFNTANMYTRQMTIQVLDYRATYKYYDPDLYPYGSGSTEFFTTEIYSDPYGNGVFSDSYPVFKLPAQATQFPTHITVWGGHKLDAVQLTYPAGGGPGGVTQTARMGDPNGGTNQPPHGGEVTIDPVNNPITKFSVTYNNNVVADPTQQVIETLYFVYSNGYPTSKFGETDGKIASGEVGYESYALSSIYVPIPNATLIGSVGCMVFGFLRLVKTSDTLEAVARHYITSPKEYSADQLAKAFPKLGLSAKSITLELKAARQKHWEWIKEHYK